MITKTKNVIQYKIKSTIKKIIFENKKTKLRKRILQYYCDCPTADDEINDALKYLSNHKLTTFNGNFQEKYDYRNVKVMIDNKNDLPYVMANNNRLYFKRKFNERTVQLTYNELLIEQDINSPHCYTDKNFDIRSCNCLADVGCAEGYFSLLNIENLNKVYLFEQDAEWVEALEATFAPWRDKVEIVPKFVSNANNDCEIRLDDFFGVNKPSPQCYKIDVEGAEMSVLNGMQNILKTTAQKIAICTYHNQNDLEILSQYLSSSGFNYRANEGVMIFQNDIDTMQPPYFRKCLIKAQK